MPNIFQGVLDQVKALGALPKATIAATKAKQQSQDLKQKLEQKISPTNAFKDLSVAKAPTAPSRMEFPVTRETIEKITRPVKTQKQQDVEDLKSQAQYLLSESPAVKAFALTKAGGGGMNVFDALKKTYVTGKEITPQQIEERAQALGGGTVSRESIAESRKQLSQEKLESFGFAAAGAVDAGGAFRPKKAPVKIPPQPFKGEIPEIFTQAKSRSQGTMDEAKAIARTLDEKGFSAAEDRRVFIDETGSKNIVLGENLRDPSIGTPDRIIFKVSKDDPTKGTISHTLKAIPDEAFVKPKEKLQLPVEKPPQKISPQLEPLATEIRKYGSVSEILPKGIIQNEIKDTRVFGSSVKGGKYNDIDVALFLDENHPSFKKIDRIYNKKVGNIEYHVLPDNEEGRGVFDAMLDMKKETGRGFDVPVKSLEDFHLQSQREVPPPPPITETIPPQKPIEGPERKFGTAVKESPETKPELKAELEQRDLTYEQLRNKTITEDAKQRIAESPESATAFVTAGKEASPEQVATSIELIRHFQNAKRYSEAADIAETIAEKLTRAGQSVQAAKLYTHLSPEAILVRAQKLVRKTNANKFRWQEDIKLTEDTAKQISELAKSMREAADPALKLEFSEELESILRNIPRPGLLRKISVVQTLAQLLNPKTLLTRNPLGNEIFFRLERLNKYIASPIDWARSTLTGSPRTVTFHTVKQGEFWKNWLQGLRSGWKGTSPAGLTTQFDIHAPAFKEKWNPLTYLEKSLGASLKSFDFAAYKRAVNQTLGELGWLRAHNEGLRGSARSAAALKYAQEASDNMLKIADEYGKYITFQDDNVISKGLSAVKRGLNIGQEFGAGDLVLKYPRTPGALLMRAIEYSPAGFLRSAYLLSKPILRAGVKANTREIELALSRAIVGSLGLTGLGYYLADKGIITGKPDENKKVTGVQRAIGGGRYQVNVSALTRWVLSGFTDTSIEPNDKLYSYDWAQPVAVALSLGANINEAQQEAATKAERKGLLAGTPGTAEASISGAIETITEQPLLTGIRNLFGGENPVDSALSVIESMPSSFTPTLLNQVGQLTDNTLRETYDPSLLKRSINRAKSRLPILKEELPVRYDVFGKEQKAFENPNLFNIFINPGFLSTYDPQPAAQMVLDIYNESGETKQLPKVAPRSLTFQGKSVQLSGEQVSKFQQQIGKATEAIFTKLATDQKFKSAPNTLKADMLNYALSKLWNVERFTILTPEQRKTLIQSMTPEEQKSFVKELKSAL